MREVRKMTDYKEMYLHLVRETEKAIQILIQAQRDCEEMYISAGETPVVVLEERRDGEKQENSQQKTAHG